jgi:hypothetical protein
MSRKKKKPNRAGRQKQQEKRAKTETEELIQDTAAVFTCSYELASDFAWQCGDNVEDLESDILFNQIAIKIWRDHSGPMKELPQVLTDLLTEKERHRDALTDLEVRFKALADMNHHEHLEHIETYRQLVRDRLALQDAEIEEAAPR